MFKVILAACLYLNIFVANAASNTESYDHLHGELQTYKQVLQPIYADISNRLYLAVIQMQDCVGPITFQAGRQNLPDTVPLIERAFNHTLSFYATARYNTHTCWVGKSKQSSKAKFISTQFDAQALELVYSQLVALNSSLKQECKHQMPEFFAPSDYFAFASAIVQQNNNQFCRASMPVRTFDLPSFLGDVIIF